MIAPIFRAYLTASPYRPLKGTTRYAGPVTTA